jgi:hypothetical protein
VASMTRSTPSRVLMSARMNRSDGPLAGTDRAVVRTLAPPDARRSTTAAPMSLVPPVTRARFPANLAVSRVGYSGAMCTSTSKPISFGQ